jgi:hypothetical protein
VTEAPEERGRRVRAVVAAAWLLVGAQLALRAWLLTGRDFYADDLMYGGEALAKSLLSPEYLLENRDGHAMPAALVLHGLLYRAFPLEWAPFAVTLLLLQLAAGLALLRLLRVVLGDRPALLVPLAVYLFCPLSLGPFTWWSAGMNSLPLQIGMAWVAADAVLLARTRRRRYAVTGTAAVVLTLLSFERAVFVPVVAFALVALLLHARGLPRPLRIAWLRGRELWIGSAVALAGWAALFVTVVPGGSTGSATATQVAGMTRIYATALAPGLLGGPWRWQEVAGPPLEAAPTWAAPLAAVLLLVLVVWSTVRLRGAGSLWALAGAHALAGALLIGVGRGAMEFAEALPRTYRYFAAEAVIAAIVVAVLFALPARRPRAERIPGPARAAVAVLLVAAFVGSSVASTVTYRRAWASDRTGDYLAAVRTSLADAGDEPLLDWDVPESVLWSHWAPWNRASLLFGGLADRPEFATATSVLRVPDQTGRLRPGTVLPGVAVAPGPEADCGRPLTASTAVALDGLMPAGEWTAELRYLADADTTVTVALGDGDPVQAPLRAGGGTVFVRLRGEGTALTVTAPDAGGPWCVTAGVVGAAAPR